MPWQRCPVNHAALSHCARFLRMHDTWMPQVLKLLGVDVCIRGQKLLSKIEKNVCREATSKLNAEMKHSAELKAVHKMKKIDLNAEMKQKAERNPDNALARSLFTEDDFYRS